MTKKTNPKPKQAISKTLIYQAKDGAIELRLDKKKKISLLT